MFCLVKYRSEMGDLSSWNLVEEICLLSPVFVYIQDPGPVINNCSNTFVTKYFHLLRLIRSYLNWNHWAAAERHTSLICWCLKVLPTSLISSSWSESVKISENYYFPGWDRHRKMKVESEISRWRSKSIDFDETLTFDTKESKLDQKSKVRRSTVFISFKIFIFILNISRFSMWHQSHEN